MKEFLLRHAGQVTGILFGADRLLFRGTLRALSCPRVMEAYCSANHVLLKDFGKHVLEVSNRVKQAAYAAMNKLKRPIKYLSSPETKKEDLARKIAQEDGVQRGPIALLTSVETCRTYSLYHNRETQLLELQYGLRRCLHLYRYQIHPVFGFMHVRLQTWFPFMIHVCLNGREWLARQMDRARLGYVRRENCFTRLADVARAQVLFDEQLKASWPSLLNGLGEEINPLRKEIFAQFPQQYYWSVHQSEFASDVMFKTPRTLAVVYPGLTRHAITTFGSGDVLRFLGHATTCKGQVYGSFKGEIVSDYKQRPEGVRVVHRVSRNSLKMYDKQACLLRVETTINEPRDFKQYRRAEGQPTSPKQWRIMRRGIADLHRRAEVSRAANERYLEALAAVKQPEPLHQITEPLCRPATWNKRRARALNPLAPEDATLLSAVNRGEFQINGFRNRDLRPLLFSLTPGDVLKKRRQSAAVTRKIRLLRAHGLVQKITGTHRYKLTALGRRAVTALVCARQTSIESLAKEVA